MAKEKVHQLSKIAAAEVQSSPARATERRAAASGDEPPRFEWVDGPVTRAARRGAWLVLEDANLAPPSVLDRLNALLEPGGELAVTEAGGAARAVRPAPAFRAFLTVDQHYGDVSRAMRNRCCHVCVAAAPPPASDPLDVDQGAGSWRAHVLDPASQRARDDADFVAGEAPAEAAASGSSGAASCAAELGPGRRGCGLRGGDLAGLTN